MRTVIIWWFWLEVIGWAALPLAYRFFRRLPDRGYAFARPLGLLLSGYILWLGATLGLLRNSLGGALVSIAVVAGVSLIVYKRGAAGAAGAADEAADELGLGAWLRANGRLVLAVELLFAGALALWSLLRAYSPDIMTAGGEKFMEIMYLNSIARSELFPPHDAWLSGYAISYYYFGYVLMALLTRLSGQAPHLTFNVGLASLFALTCTGAFGLVYNLVKGAEDRFARPTRAKPPNALSGGGKRRRSQPIAWGLLGAGMVAVLGNLEGFLEVLYSLRLLPTAFWQWLDIKDINQPFPPASVAPPSLMPTRSGWWWWRASRVIHDLDPAGNSMGLQPIDEFPGFSFLLGDMHPHVLALPFVLLALAVALWALLEASRRPLAGEHSARAGLESGAKARTVVRAEREGQLMEQRMKQRMKEGEWWAPLRHPLLLLLVPLLLGALGFLNTWDFPIYLLVFTAAYGLGRRAQYGRWSWPLFREAGLVGGATALLGFLFYLPFYVGFQSQAGGLLPTLYVGTRFRQYFVMFGPFLAAIGGLLAVLARRSWSRSLGRRWAGWTAALLLLPLAAMLLIGLVLLVTPQGQEMIESLRRVPEVAEVVGDRSGAALFGWLLGVKLRYWVMPLVVAGLAALGIALLSLAPMLRVGGGDVPTQSVGMREGLNLPGLQFALLCAIVGLLLTLSVEYVYLVDNFRARMNTIFKFYFQAWVLMGLAGAFAVYWLHRERSRLGWAFQTAFWLLFVPGLVYPVLGNISRAGNFDHPPNLDGTAYLAQSQPEDYAAIAWLNAHVDDAPVILEAPGTGGSSYVYEGRVSALTGLPTLLGWAGHEGQWRGSYEVQHAREPDIETIYNTLDPQTALTLMDKYDITYVYVGPLERSKYDPRGLEKFERFMDIVYQNDNVTIYKR